MTTLLIVAAVVLATILVVMSGQWPTSRHHAPSRFKGKH